MNHHYHPFTTHEQQECFEEAKISNRHEPDSPARQKKEGKEGRRGRREEARTSGQNFGHWTLEENKRYHWFLEIHSQHFLNKHLRRMDKIFKSMALFVASR